MSAPTAATAANGVTIDSTGGVIFQGGGVYQSTFTGRAEEIMIANRSTNSVALLVNISGMHASGEFAGLQPSSTPYYFRAKNCSIGTVTVKSASSTAVIDWAVSEV